MTDTLRDRIAAVLKIHAVDECGYCMCGRVPRDKNGVPLFEQHQADAVIGALPELPVKVTTDDELDALPFLTVIREVQPLQKGIDYGAIYERRTSGWQCIAGVWVEPECNGRPSLPVMVLWRGKDETNA